MRLRLLLLPCLRCMLGTYNPPFVWMTSMKGRFRHQSGKRGPLGEKVTRPPASSRYLLRPADMGAKRELDLGRGTAPLARRSTTPLVGDQPAVGQIFQDCSHLARQAIEKEREEGLVAGAGFEPATFGL